MADYTTIDGVSQGRHRGYVLCLTGIIVTLVTVLTAIALVLLFIMNVHYYRLFKDLPRVYKNILSSEEGRDVTAEDNIFRLVCYYSNPKPESAYDDLQLKDINDELCTHINIGMVDVVNSSLSIDEHVRRTLKEEVPILRKQNPNMKILLWVGGGDMGQGFSTMVTTHDNRKLFIKSLKDALREYQLDGVDLDWEFPSAYNRERQHFSQLLYEIKAEYIREKRDYLLTVAVASIEGIALYSYDIEQLNLYADFINLMTYDYHFYAKGTPFTGLNAPLNARSNEKSILGILNINSSVHWWLGNGMEPKKVVVGLPTYGHSFTLVNPFNNGIGAPASGFGQTGVDGFTSYTEICNFVRTSAVVNIRYDNETCSPYLYSGMEWISFENEHSIKCKTEYIKSMKLGGVMIFSLNADDHKGYCQGGDVGKGNLTDDKTGLFPLINAARRVLPI